MYGWTLYCSRGTRQWLKVPNDSCIPFILCHPTTGLPFQTANSHDPNRSPGEQMKPVPFVQGKLIDAKMTPLSFSALKEFISVVPWNPVWGNPENADVAPAGSTPITRSQTVGGQGPRPSPFTRGDSQGEVQVQKRPSPFTREPAPAQPAAPVEPPAAAPKGDGSFDATAFDWKKETLDFMNAPNEVIAGSRSTAPPPKVSSIVLTEEEKRSLADLDKSFTSVQQMAGKKVNSVPSIDSPLSNAGMKTYFGLPANYKTGGV